MSANADKPTDDNVELLLPWRATGQLSAADTARVDAALAADAGLRAQYELIADERDESVRAAEELGAPSGRAAARLFAQIEAEEARRASFSLKAFGARLVGFFGSLTPQAVALSAAAAAMVIVLEGAVLTRSLVQSDGAYHTASVEQPLTGSFALVGFAPDATAKQISDFLESLGATIVDGPRAGGLYRIRLSAKPLGPDAMKAALAALAQRRDIVRMCVASN